ncbi:MAG: LysR substrate-binding domain-containing protein, partial [Anaerolineales bacterium]
LLPWARKLIRQANEIEEMVQSMHDSIVGHLSIACSTTSGKYILPQLAARFRYTFPTVSITIQSCTGEDILTDLLMEKADIGVVSREINETDIETQPFFNDTITLIVPHNHRWAYRKKIEPAELLEEPIIIRESTSGTRQVVLSELAKYDIHLENLNIFMEIGNAEAIVRSVAEGYGIAFVSNLATACPLERGNVINLEVKGLDLKRTIYMARKLRSTSNRARDAFWSFIHAPENIDLLQLPELCK